jgi:hypothetical protein
MKRAEYLGTYLSEKTPNDLSLDFDLFSTFCLVLGINRLLERDTDPSEADTKGEKP